MEQERERIARSAPPRGERGAGWCSAEFPLRNLSVPTGPKVGSLRLAEVHAVERQSELRAETALRKDMVLVQTEVHAVERQSELPAADPSLLSAAEPRHVFPDRSWSDPEELHTLRFL